MNKILLSSLLMSLSFASYAADPVAGKAKSASCAVCHGSDGISASPIYPNLKGQKEAYLVSSMKAYKAGQRTGGLAAVMAAQATNLSEDDIKNIAAYYSSLK